MASVNTDDGGGGGKKHGKKRKKRGMPHIDMTPMVDMAFLLLTFFVLTTTLNKPKVMELAMPIDKDIPKDEITKVNHAITLLLTDKDKIFWYYNAFKPDTTVLQQTNFSKDGLRKILLDYNEHTDKKVKELEKKFHDHQLADTTFKRLVNEAKGEQNKALTAIVKTDDKATYQNVIDMLDELNLANVGMYALADITPQELEKLQAANPQ